MEKMEKPWLGSYGEDGSVPYVELDFEKTVLILLERKARIHFTRSIKSTIEGRKAKSRCLGENLLRLTKQHGHR